MGRKDTDRAIVMSWSYQRGVFQIHIISRIPMSTEQERKLMVQADIGRLRQSLNNFVLPIEKNQCARLMSHLDNELLGMTELAREILQVPAAALQICRVAGEIARQRDIDILTLEQACNMLGTLRLGSLLRSLPITENDQLPLAYRQLVSISEHALIQAQGLFANRMARLWHEVSLASLLFLSPCWVLIYHRPELMQVWDARHLDNQSAHGELNAWLQDSTQILSLAQQLAEDWWLPPWIIQGYRSLGSSRRVMVKAIHIARDSQHPQQQQALLDADRTLTRWLTLPANSLLMANGIALGAHHDWNARHTGRWQQLAALYLGCSLADVQSATHVNAVASAHAQFASQGHALWLPAKSLIAQVGNRRQQRATLKAPTQPASATPAMAPQADIALWREHCLQLMTQPTPFNQLADLLHSALEALNRGLGSTPCWIALYNGKRKQLIVMGSRGLDASQALQGMALGNCRDTQWGRWLKSRELHLIDADSLRRDSLVIPAQIKSLIEEPGTCLLPLQHRGQIIALLGARFTAGGSLSDDQQHKLLLKTAECIYQALIRYHSKV